MLPTLALRKQCRPSPAKTNGKRKRPLPGDFINQVSLTAPAAVLKVKKAPMNIERIAYLNLLCYKDFFLLASKFNL